MRYRPRICCCSIGSLALWLGGTCGACKDPAVEKPIAARGSLAQHPNSTPQASSPWASELYDELRKLRRRNRGQPTIYRAPSAEEQGQYRQFVATYMDNRNASSAAVPPPAGFRAYPFAKSGLWILAEDEHEKRGAGAIVLSERSDAKLIIEAPHTFFDSGTLSLAVALFDRLSARALVINTVHRGQALPNGAKMSKMSAKAVARSGHLPSDVAHQPEAFFSVAHDVLIMGPPVAITLQIHGYRDDRLPELDAVVSGAGSGFDVQPLAERLRRALPKARIGAFPKDTKDLGAIHNAQAELSRTLGAPFVHLELSATLRQRLTEDARARTALITALALLTDAC